MNKYFRYALTAAATTTAIVAFTSTYPPKGYSANPVQKATVTIESFQFKPAEIVLKKGGSITFTNKDTTPHTVTPANGAQFTGTGRISKNQSKTVVFSKVGTQNYFCDIHPSMKGKVTVVQ